MPRPRVAVVCGYFDWFSGYQETALVAALTSLAEVEVIAGNRVSPAFSDEHLARVGRPRTYEAGRALENGVWVTRLPVRERRSMVWSSDARGVLRNRRFDLVVQVMPGQLLPVAATLWTERRCARVVLYGDNSAMWSGLPPWQQKVKWLVFSLTKGLLYRVVNRRAQRIYNYTPETLHRLAAFQPRERAELMPLAFRTDSFFHSEDHRRRWRDRLGFSEGDMVVATAGKFSAYKELERLITAFKQASEAHPRLRLALAGADEGAYARKLRSMCENDPVLAKRTTFVGFLDSDDLNGFLNASDIGVWPKLPAVTIQQALGTGLFVVLPENDWVGHLLKDDSVGRYFDPHDEGGLTKALAGAAAEVSRGSEDRATRSRQNRWLSADGVAERMLAREIG